MNDFQVLYEDEDVVVISKPAGVVVHRDAHHISGTVADWFFEQHPEAQSVGENPDRPGVVHRLDKDTSGALLLCKNQKSFEYMKNLFQTSGIQKTYKALVVGIPIQDQGVIDEPIARSTKNFQKRVVGGEQGRSREAITEYITTEKFSNSGYALLDVLPRTGRTHQIRSHFAHIGFPIACDYLYGGKRYKCPVESGRHMLHAYSLEWTLLSGKKIQVVAPIPQDFEDVLKILRKSG
ncbi:MAG: RluA family pseudouridine synthase [Patescibacteria group bacterium]